MSDSIFVSYAWIDNEPDANVLKLVAALRESGYDVNCDVSESQSETAIHFKKMMSERLVNANKVIVVLSSKYKEKADLFKDGVGTEYQYIISDIENNKQKYVLVAFENDRNIVTPTFFRDREVITLNVDNIICDKLLHKINGTPQYCFPSVNPKKVLPNQKIISNDNSVRKSASIIGVIPSYETPFFRFLQGKGEILLGQDGPATTLWEFLLYAKDSQYPILLEDILYYKKDLLLKAAQLLPHIPDVVRDWVREEGYQKILNMCLEDEDASFFIHNC